MEVRSPTVWAAQEPRIQELPNEVSRSSLQTGLRISFPPHFSSSSLSLSLSLSDSHTHTHTYTQHGRLFMVHNWITLWSYTDIALLGACSKLGYPFGCHCWHEKRSWDHQSQDDCWWVSHWLSSVGCHQYTRLSFGLFPANSSWHPPPFPNHDELPNPLLS